MFGTDSHPAHTAVSRRHQPNRRVWSSRYLKLQKGGTGKTYFTQPLHPWHLWAQVKIPLLHARDANGSWWTLVPGGSERKSSRPNARTGTARAPMLHARREPWLLHVENGPRHGPHTCTVVVLISDYRAAYVCVLFIFFSFSFSFLFFYFPIFLFLFVLLFFFLMFACCSRDVLFFSFLFFLLISFCFLF
jgi:hypothetical protein